MFGAVAMGVPGEGVIDVFQFLLEDFQLGTLDGHALLKTVIGLLEVELAAVKFPHLLLQDCHQFECLCVFGDHEVAAFDDVEGVVVVVLGKVEPAFKEK
jgi:hypothetical protein